MWADAQRDGRPGEYRWRGALCESFLIPFLVPRRKVWLTSAAGVPCNNAANTRLGRQGARAPENVAIYSVPVQETAKRRAKFGWPLVSDVAAVTKARRESR